MEVERVADWLRWARAIQAIARTGLTYTESPFDRERYDRLDALALEIFGTHTAHAPATLGAWFDLEPGYATPKVDVRAACFRDGRILLVRERKDGRWCLPGGYADVGDSPAGAAEREVREEAGYAAAARKVVAVLDTDRDRGPHAILHVYKIIFRCDIVGGAPAENHETDGVEFFDRAAIPPLSSPRTTAKQLAECFAHLDDPGRATAFE